MRLIRSLWCGTLLVLGGVLLAQAPHIQRLLFPDGRGGLVSTVSAGTIDPNNPFFQSLGTNGRSCSTCHLPGDGWSLTPNTARLKFAISGGTDPLFRTNDGSNCLNADISSLEKRKAAFGLMLDRALIRVQMNLPAGAQFAVDSVQDPNGCTPLDGAVSVYRRPLPATNLRFLSTVMWDGRESTGPDTQTITFGSNPGDLLLDLSHQALDATNGHAQGTVPLTAAQRQQIVELEMGFTTAQALAPQAGPVTASGATGGPDALVNQDFYVGINDPLGHNPKGTTFTPIVFTLFDAWRNSPDPRRASIARGQQIFNSKQIDIRGVAGLNDVLGMEVVPGTCGTCHDSPNVGNHSFPAPLNIGVADPDSPLDVAYLPVFTLRNLATGAIVHTTDPGRALVTGKWDDIGKFKGPVLRGLSARGPYFHNGSAQTLDDVIRFYQARFGMSLTAQEKEDLKAFLGAL